MEGILFLKNREKCSIRKEMCCVVLCVFGVDEGFVCVSIEIHHLYMKVCGVEASSMRLPTGSVISENWSRVARGSEEVRTHEQQWRNILNPLEGWCIYVWVRDPNQSFVLKEREKLARLDSNPPLTQKPLPSLITHTQIKSIRNERTKVWTRRGQWKINRENCRKASFSLLLRVDI